MGIKTDKIIIDMERAVSLYKTGMTIVEVSNELKIAPDLLWRRMKKYGVVLRKAIKRDQTGANNCCWKGKEASYTAFHYRVQRLRGTPQKCEVCGTTDPGKTYDWANLTGKYGDLADYKRMCRACHHKHDNHPFGKPRMKSLTNQQAEYIKNIYVRGSRTSGTGALAKIYNVSNVTIWNYLNKYNSNNQDELKRMEIENCRLASQK